MLDRFFPDPQLLSRLQQSPLGPVLDDVAASLHDLGYSPAVAKSYLSVAAHFSSWLTLEKIVPRRLPPDIAVRFSETHLPICQCSGPRGMRVHVRAALGHVLAALKIRGWVTQIGQRDFAMALCMAQMGLRAGEVAGLSLDAIDWRAGTLRLERPKEQRVSLLPLPAPVGRALISYLRNGRAPRVISPHIVRHTTAMHLLQSGVDLSVIALWLGHESPETTHRYLEADLAMKERALDALQEPADRNKRFRPSDPVLTFLDGL
jgi:site-specific recombinase XerC